MAGKSKQVGCPVCGQVVAARGLATHQRNKHSGVQTTVLGQAKQVTAAWEPRRVAPAVSSPTGVKRVGLVTVAQAGVSGGVEGSLTRDIGLGGVKGYLTLPTTVSARQTSVYSWNVRLTTGAHAGAIVWARPDDCHIPYFTIVND